MLEMDGEVQLEVCEVVLQVGWFGRAGVTDRGPDAGN